MARDRGRTPGIYITDGATHFRFSVDKDRFAVADFGWAAVAGTENQLPRGCKPRHVTGLSGTSGRRAIAVVPDVTADIWTGAATTFDVEADDGTIDTMTVIHRIGERPSLS
jgi:hypothetical protein